MSFAVQICNICYNVEGELNEKNRIDTICHHSFHRDCLERWFTTCETSFQSPFCPMCRTEVENPFSFDRAALLRRYILSLADDYREIRGGVADSTN